MGRMSSSSGESTDLRVGGEKAGWQWAAGTGTDAAPYFRVFNPTAQADRFDSAGDYVRRWIPDVGAASYPGPMLDHAVERREALHRYRLVAGSTR